MAACRAPRSATSGLRERLSLNLLPINLMSVRVGYAAVWGNGPLSAGAIPASISEWTNALDSVADDSLQTPCKRQRMQCVTDSSGPVSPVPSELQAQTAISTIERDELARLLVPNATCDDQQCSDAPILFDLRSLPAQMCLRIRTAIGMPCESRVKMRLVLPHLDAYLDNHVTMSCPKCEGRLANSRRLIVFCTEDGSERSPVWQHLLAHLQQRHTVDARLLKGGFREFRRFYPQLCEKPVSRINTNCPGAFEDERRPSSTPPPLSAPSQSTHSLAAGSLESCGTSDMSFLLPGLTFSFESVQANASLAGNKFPSFLVSPVNCRATAGYFFPNDTDDDDDDNDELQTPKDVYRTKASRILPFLYLGNEIDCSSEQFLDSCRIRSVLNVTNKVPFLDETRFRCCRLPALDVQTQDLRPLFASAFEFIEQARMAGDAVLVHCQAGVSRSPALVIAYLMAHSGLSLRDAYRWVKSKRSVISPNFAFLGQLYDFEADLVSGRAPRKPDILDGLFVPELDESRDTDDLLPPLSADVAAFRSPIMGANDNGTASIPTNLTVGPEQEKLNQ